MSAFVYRSVILTPQDLTEATWIPTLAQAGCNTLLLHAVNLPQDITALVTWRHSTEGHEVLEQCNKFGIALEYQLHTGSWLVPRSYFWQCPEMFRLNMQGTRTSDANLCFSSPEARELFSIKAQELAKLLPSATHRYLWFADDVQEGACHCRECARYSTADQALLYANHLVQALRQVDAKATIGYLAYLATMERPELVRPAEGVFCEFAPIRRCYRHAIDDPDCAVNRTHLHRLQKLQRFFHPAPLHITEYWLDASRLSNWQRPAAKLPVPLDIMYRDIACYRDLGATSVASHAVMCDKDYWRTWGAPPVLEYGRALQG